MRGTRILTYGFPGIHQSHFPIRSGIRFSQIYAHPSPSSKCSDSNKKSQDSVNEDVASLLPSPSITVPPKNPYITSKRRSLFDIPDYASTPRLPLSHYKRYSLSNLMGMSEWPLLSITTAKDFIHNSLYNPFYGYFCRPTTPIFHFSEPVNFQSYQSHLDFLKEMGLRYQNLDKELKEAKRKGDFFLPQLWHTPTEIFKPWYGYAIANYILETYRREHTAKNNSEPLDIYEIGGGNGTLMVNVLDFLKKKAPEVYALTRYTLIELSPTLSTLQQKACPVHHQSKLHFHCGSIFDWQTHIETSCFVIALEVVDNFAHDLIRWNAFSQPYQGLVKTNEYFDFEEMYEPATDPPLLKVLELREEYLNRPQAKAFWSFFFRGKRTHSSRDLPFWHPMQYTHRFPQLAQLPFLPNFTEREFIPRNLTLFLEKLHRFFPKHHLVLSDFSSLPDTIRGKQAPVVQTRFQETMVPVSTYMVLPGFFDIFFPTDFTFAKYIYDALGSAAQTFPPSVFRDMNVQTPSRSTLFTHREFMRKYANLEATRTKSGENPLLSYYENANFMVS